MTAVAPLSAASADADDRGRLDVEHLDFWYGKRRRCSTSTCPSRHAP